MTTRIVVEDPSGQYAEGQLLEGNAAQLLVVAHAATLPADSDLLGRGAVSGYMRRGFGVGWRFDPHMPRRGCPLVLYVAPDRPVLHWVARLAVDDPSKPMSGVLRLGCDTSQKGVITCGLTADAQPPELARVNMGSGNGYFGGMLRFSSAIEGFLGLSLYGTADNCRVLWVAVSQSR